VSEGRIPLAVGLASAAVIALQIVLMQLLAIAQWHHFAYMIISTALLGFGAAGTVLALARTFLDRHYVVAMPLLLLACTVTMAASAWLAGLAGGFDAFLLFFEFRQFGLLLLAYLAYCLPFFFAGLAITLAFYREVSRIGTLYFANLAGSGAGAILAIGLLWLLPAARLTGLLAALVLLAAWVARPRAPGPGLHPAAWLTTVLAVLVSTLWPVAPVPSEYKDIRAALLLPGATVVHRSSSPHGLLEVVRAEAQRFAPSLSLRYHGEPPVRDVLFNNGEYFGTLLGAGGAPGSHVLDYTTRALPYELRRPATVLVLMAGSGNDVSHALSRGVSRVAAVEPDRAAVRLLQSQHPEWIEGIYRDPAVSVHGHTPRTYLARHAAERHDLIVLPVLGSFGGDAGVHALHEHYHLTLEAFRSMWAGLSGDGMIAVTVWQEQPARASLRLLATWRALLDEQEVENRGAHVAAIRSWGTMTLLLSRSPFLAEERARLRSFGDARLFDPLILEGLDPDERERFNGVADRQWFTAIDTLLAGDPGDLFDASPFDLRPATDNRPFFWRFVQWRGLPELRDQLGGRQLPYLELGFFLAVVTFVQIGAIAVLLIVLPLFRMGWAGAGRRWTLGYFAGLGLGFIFFEIVLIQKLTLYLGQPVYAAAAVLAVLLVSSGSGSWFSARLPASGRVLRRAGLLVAGLILACALGLPALLGWSVGWHPFAKAAVVFVALALPAFMMGMMFPLGLRRLAGAERRQIPWACAIDSCMSVTATALATLVALDAGFGAVMLLAAGVYALAGLAGSRLRSPGRPRPRPRLRAGYGW
jgi:hypothetical protein